jgi:hypothetical protein
MPPKVTVETAKGFTLYMLKAVLDGSADEIVELSDPICGDDAHSDRARIVRPGAKGGCRREVDATAGLPSAPERPCAPRQLRFVPRADQVHRYTRSIRCHAARVASELSMSPICWCRARSASLFSEPVAGCTSPRGNDIDVDDRCLIYVADRIVRLDVLKLRQ